MKFLCRIAIFLLTITCVLSSFSCSSGDNGQTTTTIEKTPSRIVNVLTDGATDYQIIRPAALSKSSVSVHNALKTKLSLTTGVFVDMSVDTAEIGAHEILVGKTNRPLSQNAYAALSENQFSFSAEGDSIAIAAWDDDCLNLAIDKFMELFVQDKNISFDAAALPMTFNCTDEYTEVAVNNLADIGGDDPYVVSHNGYYYYCWSDGGVRVAQIDNLNKITKENAVLVFDRHKEGFESVWAPELHYIDGEWYIYVAMCKGTSDNAKHRMYVLKGTSQDPTDPFTLVGQITDSTNKWAIDGTVFEKDGEMYFVWSGWEGNSDGRQDIYIAHMSDPATIDSKRVRISTPSTWDNLTKNPSVNEGPCVVVTDDAVFVLYSGNGSWTDDYSIGYLSCTDGDFLNASSWKKSKTAILSKSKKCYGPGHCSVAAADDGSLYVIFHANIVSGSGWSGRSVRIAPLSIEGTKINKVAVSGEVMLPIGHKVLAAE